MRISIRGREIDIAIVALAASPRAANLATWNLSGTSHTIVGGINYFSIFFNFLEC